MSCLEEIKRKVLGKTCDVVTEIKFIKNGIPYLTSCNNVLIALYAGKQTIPFAKFSYKPLSGEKPFSFKTGTDEAQGIAYISVESEDTSKATEGTVRMQMNIDAPSEFVSNSDTNTEIEIYQFI